jgi:hypothetical protein
MRPGDDQLSLESPSSEDLRRLLYLGLGAVPLQCQQEATWPAQRITPADQPIQRRDRPGHDNVVPPVMILGALSYDCDPPAEAELVNDLNQERRPTKQGLEESDIQIGSEDCQRDSRQPSSAANVNHGAAFGYQLAKRRAIQDMAIPHPVCLARSQQPPLHSPSTQYFGVRFNSWTI